MKNSNGSYSLRSRIIETKLMDTVYEHIGNDDTLVIFDVDNTLLYPGNQLGTETWISWMAQQQLARGTDAAKATQELFALFSYVHEHIDVYAIEPRASEILNNLKQKSISTMTLTGRPFFMIDRTSRQLDTLGYVLNAPQELREKRLLTMTFPVGIGKGIVCSGINDKGIVINSIFDTIVPSVPKNIICVDDKLSCLESVGKVCFERGVNYTGIRYGYLDDQIEVFDPTQAQNQLDKLLKEHEFKCPSF